MIVTTHFEPTDCYIASDYVKMLEVWRRSWESQGFVCVITGKEFIESRMGEKGVKEFCDKVDGFPSVNGNGFDRASFRRWLAAYLLAGQFGHLVITEGDVVNYSFGRKEFEKMPVDKFNIADKDGCPAVAYGGVSVLDKLIQSIVNHEIRPEDSYEGRPHLSDQDFIARYSSREEWYRSDKEIIGSAFDKEGWENKPIVHYGTPFFMQSGYKLELKCKADWIEEVRAL